MGGKKRRIVYKDAPDDRAAELEEFLFGSKNSAADVFSKRKPASESDDDDLTLAGLLGGTPSGSKQLFFEDKQGDPPDFALSHSEDEEEEQAGSEGEDSEQQQDHEDEDNDNEVEEERAARAGTNKLAGPSSTPKESRGKGDGGARRPVWEDPADQALQVNLAISARLRKLRTSHQQTTVDGRTYQAALRKQHALLHPRTSWARLGSSAATTTQKRKQQGSDEDEGDEDGEGMGALLSRAGGRLASHAWRLAPGHIEASRLKDGNVAEPSRAVVRSVGWHPSGQLLLTAGLDKKLRLFKVDGQENPLVQAVHLQDCPMQRAGWASGGAQIVAVGRRPFFYLCDLATARVERITPHLGAACAEERLKSLETFAATPPGAEDGPLGHALAFCGDQGQVPLLSLRSRQWAGSLKMQGGSARCAAWAPGGNHLLTLGGDGVVHTWDMRMQRCLYQLRDHANVGPSALCLSPDGRHLATGSVSGAVNLYPGPASPLFAQLCATAAAAGSRKLGGGVASARPVKEVLNLVTTVDSLEFSHDSQLLALASRMKKDALRLLHVQSRTVYSNWPTSRTPLHYVHSLAFSPHSGFLSIGNAKGRALLYRMHQYGEA